MTSEANGGTTESADQPKGDLFSSMKNQMSSWLAKKEVKEDNEEQQQQEQQTKVETPEKPAENEIDPATGSETAAAGEGEGFGSGNFLGKIE